VFRKNLFLEKFLIEYLYNKERTFVLSMNTKKNIFLTPREASELTGKSEITIKRLAKQLFNKATTNNDHKVLSLITKKKAPKGFFWKIEEEFLKEQFNISSSKENEENSENKMLKEQIKIKDEQISQLLERQRESNILLKNSQDKNLMLEAKTEEIEKKGFWKNIFG
jgi:isocitrate dehydrogenase